MRVVNPPSAIMEHIRTPKVENVRLVDKLNPRGSPMGTLYLTTTHLIFVSNSSEEADKDDKELPGDREGDLGNSPFVTMYY